MVIYLNKPSCGCTTDGYMTSQGSNSDTRFLYDNDKLFNTGRRSNGHATNGDNLLLMNSHEHTHAQNASRAKTLMATHDYFGDCELERCFLFKCVKRLFSSEVLMKLMY